MSKGSDDLVRQEWFTLFDDSWYSVDFAISGNISEDGKALACFQLYSTESGDNESVGNIYVTEDKITQLIKDLTKVKRSMQKFNKLNGV